ncbi:hypothetical protein [Thermonema rossianum]|uniref:hypothetical protein n=1 Tax=Thermonema rossianum TaxID=55505 RepID=UPI00056DCE3A|nr:hypothetical protein [Thermonema rossianum]
MIATHELSGTTQLFQPGQPSIEAGLLPGGKPAASLRLLSFDKETVAMLYLPQNPDSWEVLSANEVILYLDKGAVLKVVLRGRHLLMELSGLLPHEQCSFRHDFEHPPKRIREVVWQEHVLYLSMW